MKTRTTIILSLVLLIATTTFAVAQPGPRGGGRCDPGGPDGHGPFTGRLCDKLDLTEDQQTIIDAIREKSRETGLEIRKQVMRLRNELKGLMLQDDPDSGDVEKLVRRIGDLKTDQRVRHMQTRLAVRAELTDQQRDKMIAIQGNRQGRGGRGHAPVMRDGCGHGEGRHGGYRGR